MRRLIVIILLTFLLCSLYSSPCSPAVAYVLEPSRAAALSRGIEYLRAVQNRDGGFAREPGRPSSADTTAWVIMGLTAAGEDVNAKKWRPDGQSPLDYLNSGKSSLEATTDYARTLMALMAGKHGPVFRGSNLAEKIVSFQQPNGQFAQTDKGELELINAHLWAIIALASAGSEIPQKEKALDWLKSCQNRDGGFGWARGLDSDPDDTGIALTALILLGEKPEKSPVIQKAISYLQIQQDEEGGFKWTGQKSNSATDSWVIQGLVAAGADLNSPIWQVKGKSPLVHLLSFQNKDGSFNWTRDVKSAPALMTAYALIALSNRPLPVNIDFMRQQAAPLKISLTVGSMEALVGGSIEMLDAPPVLINNRVLVPLRFVGEHLGADIQWIPESSKVKISYGGETLSLIIGQTTAELDTPAIIEGGRTLVPLRYISEKLGASVYWSGNERRIEIEK